MEGRGEMAKGGPGERKAEGGAWRADAATRGGAHLVTQVYLLGRRVVIEGARGQREADLSSSDGGAAGGASDARRRGTRLGADGHRVGALLAHLLGGRVELPLEEALLGRLRGRGGVGEGAWGRGRAGGAVGAWGRGGMGPWGHGAMGAWGRGSLGGRADFTFSPVHAASPQRCSACCTRSSISRSSRSSDVRSSNERPSPSSVLMSAARASCRLSFLPTDESASSAEERSRSSSANWEGETRGDQGRPGEIRGDQGRSGEIRGEHGDQERAWRSGESMGRYIS